MSSPLYLQKNLADDLYRDHHPWLREWLRRRLNCSETAADLAQDTFLRILVKPYVLDGIAGTRKLLTTVAGRLCVDLWRRRDIEKTWLETLAHYPEQFEPSPEHRTLVIEALCELDAMLGTLPNNVATTFLLAQIHGLPYREIAEHLQVSERMVKKYMAQAVFQCAVMEAGLDIG